MGGGEEEEEESEGGGVVSVAFINASSIAPLWFHQLLFVAVFIHSSLVSVRSTWSAVSQPPSTDFFPLSTVCFPFHFSYNQKVDAEGFHFP